MPVSTKIKDPKSGAETPIVVSEDDGVRGSTTMESLAMLNPAFKKNGTTTAGSSSQVSWDFEIVGVLLFHPSAARSRRCLAFATWTMLPSLYM